MPHTVTIDSTGNALDQYCVRYSQRIHQTLRQGLEFEQDLPYVSTDYAYQGQDAEVADVLQPYQKGFTPRNTETFSGVLNILQLGKYDLNFDWAEMQKFFDKWRCNWFEAGKDENEWSYPRYVMENLIMPKVIEEMNLNSWQGAYAAPTPGTPGAMLETYDGFGTKIAAAVTATDLVPIATGAFVANTMVAQIRAFCNSIPVNYRYKAGTIYMSKTLAQMYADDYQGQYPHRTVTIDNPDSMYMRVDHYNKTIRGLSSMEGSSRIVMKFDNLDSLIVGTKTGEPILPSFRFHVYDRELHVLAEQYRFFGFETYKHMFVNDQA